MNDDSCGIQVISMQHQLLQQNLKLINTTVIFFKISYHSCMADFNDTCNFFIFPVNNYLSLKLINWIFQVEFSVHHRHDYVLS